MNKCISKQGAQPRQGIAERRLRHRQARRRPGHAPLVQQRVQSHDEVQIQPSDIHAINI